MKTLQRSELTLGYSWWCASFSFTKTGSIKPNSRSQRLWTKISKICENDLNGHERGLKIRHQTDLLQQSPCSIQQPFYLLNSVSSSFGEDKAATDLNCNNKDFIREKEILKSKTNPSRSVNKMQVQQNSVTNNAWIFLCIPFYLLPPVAYTSCVWHAENNRWCSTVNFVWQELWFSNLMPCKRYSVLELDSARCINKVKFPAYNLYTKSKQIKGEIANPWVVWLI